MSVSPEPLPPLPRSRLGMAPLDVARECARLACSIIRETAGAGVAAVKGRGNVVTETDFAVERAVFDVLGRHYPDHAILSEETASAADSDGWLWVVDPLDGTKNFSRGIPHFAFTIALCFQHRPLVALTAHPLLGDEFTAVAGQGCALNGQPARVRPCPAIADAVVALDLGYDADRARRQLELAARLWPGMQSLRITGSAALGFAYLAAGRWDLYVHSDLQPWDVAAGLVLVREAGGEVLDRSGQPATIRSRAVVAGGIPVLEDFGRLAAGSAWE
ncbi:inositol monophosphatase family protein [Tepidiforma sp.]|uniref:inositol monophosphatase family protein n=1 Tax=Tepidiforma sp. TaxID=2682230 RepID=UPI002ADDFA31|nr:inositol monophosphatase family protein [Tepidiforma sp.]